MSEYQRYEFMTSDRPLTRAELEKVNHLSSHIEASSTHALIEYHWGDFKYNPIDVLRKYFDGFLYWANWGSPQLAFRFPHGSLPADLLGDYDFSDNLTFKQHNDYDILHIDFGEMEPPDEWEEYELGPLMPVRDELLEGDLRSFYIVWLAFQATRGRYYKGKNEIDILPVPPGFGKLTEAQKELANLLRIPTELLMAVGGHSSALQPAMRDDFVSWVRLLPPERRDDYLVRLARNQLGLSRLLVQELRELGRGKTGIKEPTGERVPYATLLEESKAIREREEREERERQRQARLRRLQEVHENQDTFWRQANQAALRATGAGYDEAARVLGDLRDAAQQFNETQAFQERVLAWIQPHQRRPALLRRLHEKNFPLPEG